MVNSFLQNQNNGFHVVHIYKSIKRIFVFNDFAINTSISDILRIIIALLEEGEKTAGAQEEEESDDEQVDVENI